MKDKLSRLAIVAVMLVTGFSVFASRPATQTAYAGSDAAPINKTIIAEDKFTEANQAKLLKAQPPVSVDKSLERANLNARLKFLNDENRIGYVYLLADTGQVIAEYTIKGKASSLNSYITQMEQIRCQNPDSSSDKGCIAAEAPDLDGSYGHNVEGIFFFTTEGDYVEWSGRYIYSSQSLNINTPVSLTRTVQ